jgi:hypothetical protein
MEELAEMLAELRVVFAELLENSGTESKALPQTEAPSSTFPEDPASDEDTRH